MSSVAFWQILQSLSDLHEHSIVHNALDPSHIAWFPMDFCWKLLKLETASNVGDRIPFPRAIPRRYAAPETQKAAGHVKCMTSTDMWAFGLIAFEVTTGELHSNVH